MSSSVITLGLALSTRSWRGLLQRHCRDHVADVNATLLRDALDAGAGGVSIVMLDDDTSWLSAPALDQMRESGVVVIGLYDPTESDGHGERHLQRLGVDVVVPCDLGAEDLVEIVRSVAPDGEREERFADLVDLEDDRIPRADRQIIAVGGPAGSGATEVSIARSQLWGGIRPLLVDVDETNPSIARRLGLSIHPHIVTAVEALRGERLSLDPEANSLEACLAQGAVGAANFPFDVIVGLASRDDWSLLRADDVGSLIEELSARWPLVVARLGPNLEDLSRHVGRYGVSRTVAARATRVVGVCDATPVGMLRFFDWLVDIVAIADATPVDVVINRCPRSPSAQAQLMRQLDDVAGPRIGDVVLARRDRRIERAAWDADLADRGPFLKAIGALPFDSTVVVRSPHAGADEVAA